MTTARLFHRIPGDRETIPGVTEVVELNGAKLFFPDERADQLATLLHRHWAR